MRVAVWMKRVLALAGAAVLAVVIVTAPALADEGDDWRITRMAIAATGDTGGDLAVRMAFTFDFGTDDGHGPYLTFPTRMALPGDDSRWRVLTYEGFEASSPSGAPAQVHVDSDGDSMAVRIGDEDVRVSGPQDYVVSYTVRDVANPNAIGSGLDEYSWNALGNTWEVPIDDVTVTLDGVAGIEKVACFFGHDYDRNCEANHTQDMATVRQSRLDEGEGLQIVVGYPVGTLSDATPQYTKRVTLGSALRPSLANLGGGAAVVGVGGSLAALLYRRFSRDRQYAGLTPGLRGAPGAATTFARSSEVAVRFTPPDDATPGLIGTLVDSTPDVRDVTANIINMAVRGAFDVEQVSKKRYTLHQRGPRPDLDEVDGPLYDALFDDGPVVELHKNEKVGQAVGKAQQALYSQVTSRGWYRTNPVVAVAIWLVTAIVLGVVGVVLAVVLSGAGLSWLGIGLTLVAVLVFVLGFFAPARTAEGRMVLEQTRGFRLYLETAEADQLRFEEGEDLFSRYLPYAIAFGCADRWAVLFQQLRDMGRDIAEPSWFHGATMGSFYGDRMASSFADSLSSDVQSGVSASAGGGSGFSGGGGVGGGGGGGW